MDPTTDDEEAGISGLSGGGGVRGESSAAEAAVEAAARVVAEVSGLPESRGPLRRLCGDLARRVKLLAPLLDELRDCAAPAAAGSLGEREVQSLATLHGALVSAKDLLRSVYDGSKIYQALQRENFASKFLEVNEKIEKALDDLSYGNLHISEEVLEQVELVHAQFRRAKATMDSPDPQLVGDLFCTKVEKPCDNLILKRISENLQLRTMNDMKKESVALHEMVISSDGVPDECLEEMSSLLKNLTDCVLDENPTSDTVQSKTSPIKNTSPVIPDEFRCPISLELMRDPVIVSTGQGTKIRKLVWNRPLLGSAEDGKEEIQELHPQQREISERLRDPRGLRRFGVVSGNPCAIGRGPCLNIHLIVLAMKPQLLSCYFWIKSYNQHKLGRHLHGYTSTLCRLPNLLRYNSEREADKYPPNPKPIP